VKPRVFTQWAQPAAAVPAANLPEPVGSNAHRASGPVSGQRPLLARQGLSDRALAWLFVRALAESESDEQRAERYA